VDPLAEALRLIASCLEQLKIAYAIGGSVASAAHGVVRSTLDVDLIAMIDPAHADQAERLAAELGPRWYAEPQQIRDATVAGRSFNLIYIPRSVKVDIFPAADEFGVVQLERARPVPLPFLGDDRLYPVTTAEDILLAKLRWYAAGGEVSERQWNDITGIIAVNEALDFPYLNVWAERLGVARLLARALEDARE
jgi:hypothetical protein